MVLTIFALFLRIISNPFANAFQKKIAQKNSALVSNFYTYLFLSLICIPFAIQVQWEMLPVSFWFNAFFAGMLCATGTACLIKALQNGELSVLGPINSYKAIVGLITAFFLLHEIPTIAGLIGMILIIYGSWFVFDTTKEGFSWELFKRKDILLRFAALIFTGIEAAFLKKAIILSSPVISFYLWCFTGALFAFLLAVIFKKKFEPVKKEFVHQYLIVALGLMTMQLSTNFVFNRMNVGFALALFQLSTLVNLFLGYKMFHETDMKKKIIGTLIMILGSVLILLKSF